MLATMAKRTTKTDQEAADDGKAKRVVTDLSPQLHERLLDYIAARHPFPPKVADVLRYALERLLDDEDKK
ncbi:MAG: hypothetical protein K2X38_00245 [Gemmataceae bacterium]|nr:hypothetical protein [Gemmataceae bacterium]